MHSEIKSYVNSYQPQKKKPAIGDPLKTKDTFYSTRPQFNLSAKQEKEIIKETEYEFERR
jgi:hypothetical protein